jgi:hypothetical protein
MNIVTDHRSFADCAHDLSMQHCVENGLKQLLRLGPLYRKVGTAAHCLSPLKPEDFPIEIAADVAVLFSVFQHIRYIGRHGEYAEYRHIPRRLQREWFPALLRIYRLLMISKGTASVLPIGGAAKIDIACREHVSAVF